MKPYLKYIAVIAIIISGISLYFFFKAEQELHAITADQAIENRAEEPGIIIDVRSKREYDQGSLKNALISYDYSSGEFEGKLDSLDKSKTYYLYCASGNRSGKAARLMKEKGFENVHNLGGYKDLINSGFEKE